MTTDNQDITKIVIGIDLGSITAKIIFMDQNKKLIEHHYLRHKGRPGETLVSVLEDMFSRYPKEKVYSVGITGSGGKRIAPFINATFINEVISETFAVSQLVKDAHSIINIGGQDSKLIDLHTRNNGKDFIIENFAMNTLCAAGTGAFLDQQATRLGVNIEGEFGELALKSKNPPRIAGRCSVFAKSDMIHLQQKGTPLHDIVSGLCYAMARNFKATIGKNSEIQKNVAFIGGVANNKGMVKAFQDVLELKEGELIIPEHNSLIGAIGAAYNVFNSPSKLPDLETIKHDLQKIVDVEEGLAPLHIQEHHLHPVKKTTYFSPEDQKTDVYLGVDVGSISTKVILIDTENNLLAERYLRTGSQPIDAVKRGLKEIGEEMAEHVNVLGACTTGSARYLIGDFIGADLVKDEITAHARGAKQINPNVDTIFEIGGQDSKYISIENGAIVDFEMNKVCAAGTGSFLEEQSERLAIDIKNDFSKYALKAQEPSLCGERCTVFMESDIIHHQQKGVPKEDIVAGLAYSIVYNYINKVVEGRKIGETIFLQGGVAFNKGVIAGFETVLGKPVIVPPNHEHMGSIGAALLVKDIQNGQPSKFKGWNSAEQEYKIMTFDCKHCANNCTINKVTIGKDSVFYYGSRCDRYDKKSTDEIAIEVPDYYEIRDTLLRTSYSKHISAGKGRGRIGIPLSMTIYEDYPVWNALFTELGYEVILSEPTNKSHIERGLESVVEETCFPIKVLHGHVLELVDKKVDYIFLPFMMDMWSDNPRLSESLLCSYVQSSPDLLKCAFNWGDLGVRVLSPAIKPSVGDKFVVNELYKVLGPELLVSKSDIAHALQVGKQALNRFRENMVKEGEKALSELGEDEFAIAIISRPYNGPDRGINLDIPRKFNNLGVKVIPMDFLPLATVDVQEELPTMFWWFGHRVLGAAKIIRDHPKLYPVYINNFACGPDSFALQYFLYMIGNKPNLILEIDEHSADAGVMTRAEAFLDSIKYLRTQSTDYKTRDLIMGKSADVVGKNILKSGKKLYFPPVNRDHVFTLAAAFNAHGLNTEVLPDTDDESLIWARKYTNNKECYPYIIITGDIVKMTQQPGFDPDNSAFLMPAGNGVCRLNHYDSMQRIVFKKLGIEQVELYAPIAEKAITDMGKVNLRLPIDCWNAVTAADCLFKAYHQTRPYEVKVGQTDEVYAKLKELLNSTVLNKGNVINTMKIARKAFDEIKVDKSIAKPKIGIIGEFYVRWHPYSNSNILQLIEKLGGEVVCPSVAENMLHFNHTIRDDTKRKKKYVEFLTQNLSGRWQVFQEHRIYKPFADFLEIYPEPSVQELEDLAQPYASEINENEIVISLGKARWLLETGKVHGIVNLIPFTCLLGTPIAAMLKRLKEDFPNAAITTFKFDGAADVNILTRLEAYMHQAHQYVRTEDQPPQKFDPKGNQMDVECN
ncbi:acyl-CoA dehydratase activase [Candidatus Lokiarchaeum ossiferum]|uniref:acyl-CoA dehydratase activase n=1 Tax=Candidatus Lokiarchaeum ossiferum TaxID=2951803 RepID=UPI00352F0286